MPSKITLSAEFLAGDRTQVAAAIDRLSAFCQKPSTALKQIAPYQLAQLRSAFEGAFDPETGKAWQPLAPSTVRTPSGAQAATGNRRPLQGRTNRIGKSLYSTVSDDGIEIGYSEPLAALHDAGATVRPHRVVPKTKKALFWNGAAHPVRYVNHPGCKIPRRRLIGVSPADIERWEAIAAEEALKAWQP